MAGEAAYLERLEGACDLFRNLAQRARTFRDRLPEIQRLVEERNRLGWDVEAQRSRREELNREIGVFYAAWREFIREAREAAGALIGVLPVREVEAFEGRLSETAVGLAAEALEAVSRRLEEFAAAARRKRRAVSAKTTERPEAPPRAGRWVTAAEYAAHIGVSVQTLANWRWQDRKAGRDGPGPGKPLYRRFGRSVRYLLPEEEQRPAAPAGRTVRQRGPSPLGSRDGALPSSSSLTSAMWRHSASLIRA